MMISDLPKDLETEILARVPAKSLQDLKTTCKRWYAMFRDPKFVEKNKKMSNEAARESMLLSNQQVYSIAGDLHNSGDIEQSLEFTGKLSIDLDFDTISHCDGLMLCQANDYSILVVWNPCTGETKMIEPRTGYRKTDELALGYSSSTCSRRSYKILRCGYCLNEEKVEVVECEMYDLCSDSWRILDSFPLDYVTCCSGVSLRGDTYFVAYGYEDTWDSAEEFLMKFDFTAERFVRLPLPLPYQSFGTCPVLSVVRDEKLSVCRREIAAGSNVMRICVSNKVDEEGKDISWRKDFVMKVDFDKFELWHTANVSSFLLDEEKKVAVCCGTCEENGEKKITIFVVGEDMYKQVYNATIKGNCPFVLTYVPSLVCIH